MRAKSLFILIFLLCLFACGRPLGKDNAVFKVFAIPVPIPVTVDGVLNETVWEKAQTIQLVENKTGNTVRDSSVLTFVKICYDPAGLYIAFICNDPDIWGNFSRRDEHLWTEEVVEVFLDTDAEPNTYFEFEVSPKNVLFDSYIVDPVNIDFEATAKCDLPTIQTAVAVDGSLNNRTDRDRRWTVEMAIPFADILPNGKTVIPGKTKWKINFYRLNRDNKAASLGYAWSPTGGRFHNPAVFGTLVFQQ